MPPGTMMPAAPPEPEVIGPGAFESGAVLHAAIPAKTANVSQDRRMYGRGTLAEVPVQSIEFRPHAA